MKYVIRIIAMYMMVAVFFTSAFSSLATETTSELESEVSDLEKELKDLNKDLDKISAQIKETSSKQKQIRKELAIAKGKADAQYDSMMVRIKYMYENGNSTILEMLFSSTCLPEFLSRAEFYSAITQYDRKLLAEYKENLQAITAQEAELKRLQETLKSLQEDLIEKQKNLETKHSTASTKLAQAIEDAKKAQAEAEKEVIPVKPPSSSQSSEKPSIGSSQVTETGGVSYTDEDVTLLAALIECEAGSRNYDALLAVGAVVVNRMKSRYYPDTLTGVVYQKGQFPPASDGKVDQVLSRGVKDLCVKAAIDALNGKSNVGDCVRFRAASSGYQGTIIGDNVFF